MAFRRCVSRKELLRRIDALEIYAVNLRDQLELLLDALESKAYIDLSDIDMDYVLRCPDD